MFKCSLVRHIRLRFPWGGQVQRFPRPIDTGGIQGIAAHLFHRNERKVPSVAGDPVRHNEQTGQQDLSRDGQLRQLVHAGKAAFLQGVVKQFPPAALPEFLFPLGPIVGFPAASFVLIPQLVKHILPGLWLAVVCTCYRCKPVWAFQPPQNGLARQRMKRVTSVLRPVPERCVFFQALSGLLQKFHNRPGKTAAQFTNIMHPPQKAGSLCQQVLVQSDVLTDAFRQPPLHQIHHNTRRIPQVHPERQPVGTVRRVCFACKQPHFVGNTSLFHPVPPPLQSGKSLFPHHRGFSEDRIARKKSHKSDVYCFFHGFFSFFDVCRFPAITPARRGKCCSLSSIRSTSADADHRDITYHALF